MAKKQNVLKDLVTEGQKVINDSSIVKEIKSQQAKSKEHDDKISTLETKQEEVKEEIAQIKDTAKEVTQKVDKNEKKNKEQDTKLLNVESQLKAEVVKLETLYKNLEDESNKIAELHTIIYNLTQKDTVQAHTDEVQNIKAKDLEAKLQNNRIEDNERSSDIAKNKANIESNLKKIENINKELKTRGIFNKFTSVIAIISLVGVIGLYILQIIK